VSVFPSSENIDDLSYLVFTRDSMLYSAYMPRQFRLSVCHTRVLYQNSKAERIVEIISLLICPSFQFFVIKGCCANLTASRAFTPNVGTEYKGGSDFRPICGHISETVIDRHIFTMEDEYKDVCALSNSATFDDLE